MNYYKFFFVAFLIGISFAFYYIIYPFFLAIVFALILAHFFKKPYRYFLDRVNERVASLLSVVMVLVVLVIPFLLMTVLLTVEARRGYGQVQRIFASGLEELQSTLEQNSMYQDLKENPEMVNTLSSIFLDKSVQSVEEVIRVAMNGVKEVIAVFFQNIQSLLVNITGLLFNFFIMLYMLYFFFKEGDNVMAQIKHFIPMEEEETQELIDEAFKIIDATFIGTLIIGIIEGSYGAMIFYWQGVPSPVTWGVMMIGLSMLPIVGTNGVLAPLAIYRIVTGDYLSGAVILVVGCGGILVSQNIIKPKLVGDRSGLHPALIVLSTLGGIFALGISGFLIGPIIATLFVVFWKLFRKKITADNILRESQKS